MIAPWNKDLADLLLWLAQEESALYGECAGRSLDALKDAGFVEITSSGRPIREYDVVTLTSAGWARVTELRRHYRVAIR